MVVKRSWSLEIDRFMVRTRRRNTHWERNTKSAHPNRLSRHRSVSNLFLPPDTLSNLHYLVMVPLNGYHIPVPVASFAQQLWSFPMPGLVSRLR